GLRNMFPERQSAYPAEQDGGLGRRLHQRVGKQGVFQFNVGELGRIKLDPTDGLAIMEAQVSVELAGQRLHPVILRVRRDAQLGIPEQERVCEKAAEEFAAKAAMLELPLHAESDLASRHGKLRLLMQLGCGENAAVLHITQNSGACGKAPLRI